MIDRVTSFPDLLAFLAEENAPHRQDADAQVVQIPVQSGALDGYLYLRWEKTLPYLQIIAPMILEVPDARTADVIEAVSRVNHAIALPGFAFDFQKRFIYFRLTLRHDDDGIRPELLRRMMLSTVSSARDFVVALRAVVDGEAGAGILGLLVAEEPQAAEPSGQVKADH